LCSGYHVPAASTIDPLETSLAGALLAAGLLAADGACALEIVQTRGFTKAANVGFGGTKEIVAVASLALDPFDPTLGTRRAPESICTARRIAREQLESPRR